jgi:ATP-dependent DNA helicase RecQ
MGAAAEVQSSIQATLKKYWGFDTLRPLQEAAIRAGVEARDSLVVMPTGGGKSLCYQVPPIVARRTDVVVSPLIALMKDQVDGLRQAGYPAAALHSGMDPDSLREIELGMAEGHYRLIFAAPERLVSPRFLQWLANAEIRNFAVDEAHCISHWGHDFRPEYRQLAELKERLPGVSLHAFTATATLRVRDDIIAQLKLRDPVELIGNFDRPNLVYRVLPRVDAHRQTLEILNRHRGEAAIVYCLSRRDTEDLAASLAGHGLRAAHYHAGMDPEKRRRTQEEFMSERLDVVVATVAFGMGIDRSDVRCVIHTAMPKSVEHYQQEAGRAGRDGLAAECVLLYSGADAMRLQSLIERSAAEAQAPPQVVETGVRLLQQMRSYASSLRCRHATLSEYFGQRYEAERCGACDVCLEEVEGVEDGTVTAQKILSCIARTDQRFGAAHIADVLVGANNARIRQWRHDKLTTHGLLAELPRKSVLNLVYQLVDQGLVDRSEGDRPILELNSQSWEVMRGERKVQLQQPRGGDRVKRSRAESESWDGVDRDLFESLRALRRDLAGERGVPAYVIFGDATLRELARVKPTTLEDFAKVRGVGEKKLQDLGGGFVAHIREYCDHLSPPRHADTEDGRQG